MNYVELALDVHPLVAFLLFLVFSLFSQALFCLPIILAFYLKEYFKVNPILRVVVFTLAIYFARLLDLGLFPMAITSVLGGFDHSYKQLFSLFGLNGLEAIFLLVNGYFAFFLIYANGSLIVRVLKASAIMTVTVLGLQGLANYELSRWTVATSEEIQFVLYQPGQVGSDSRSIQQKYEDEIMAIGKVKHLLSKVEELDSLDFVVFPETFVFSNVNENSPGLSFLREAVKDLEINLFSGGHAFYPQNELNNNVLFFMDKKGEVFKEYSKYFLMPFGETKPLKVTWPSLSAYLPGRNLYAKGSSLEDGIYEYRDLKVGLAICYEDIQYEVYNNFIKNEVNVILVVSSDNQFSSELFARNHMAAVHSIALAYRLPLIRATSTGISTVQNQTGETVIQTDYGGEEMVPVALSIPSKVAKSFYSRYRSTFPYIALVFLILVLVVNSWIRERE